MRAARLTAAALLSTLLALASATAIQAGTPYFHGSTIRAFATTYAAPGAISEVPDPTGASRRVFQVTVHNRDVYPITPTDNPRATLASPNLLQPGMEIWMATEFLVPIDYPRVPPGGWVTLASFYGPPYRSSSPWQLELVGPYLQWQRNSSYGFDVPFEQRLRRGHWTSILLHERFSRHGFVELWIDGRKVEFFDGATFNPHRHAPSFRLKMETRDHSNDYGANSARIGQYRKAGMFDVGTLYFGPLRIGSTRASVTS